MHANGMRCNGWLWRILAATIIASAIGVVPAASQPAEPGAPENGASPENGADDQPAPPPAVEPPQAIVARRIAEVAAMIADNPTGIPDVFSRSMLQQVSARQLTAVFRQYFRTGGPVVETLVMNRPSAFGAEVEMRQERRMRFTMTISVEAVPPHKVEGLFFGAPEPIVGSVGEVVEKIAALPGMASAAVYRWSADNPEPVRIFGHNAETALGIGSTCKLYILGALIDEINHGRREFSHTLPLRRQWKSMPSGMLHTWPDGSPISLHTFAAKMISISDNTATDHLLHILGRERVEAHQAVMGHANPTLNQPFLATLELFRLKETGKTQARQTEYLGRDEVGRRAYLADVIAPLAGDEFGGIALDRPTAIDTLEWFASADDLCRAMAWLWRHTADGMLGQAGREILAINPGLRLPESKWAYIGYKGGSEPGVLNLTFLLQARESGDWFAVSLSNNNTAAPLDNGAVMGLAAALIDTAAR